jgi:rubrerythrin
MVVDTTHPLAPVLHVILDGVDITEKKVIAADPENGIVKIIVGHSCEGGKFRRDTEELFGRVRFRFKNEIPADMFKRFSEEIGPYLVNECPVCQRVFEGVPMICPDCGTFGEDFLDEGEF